jgi:UDP-perosamine 4-acetyltransferase
MNKNIVIVGTGGHARVVASLLQNMGGYKIVGCVDRKAPNLREKISGVPVIGTWSQLESIFDRGVPYAALAIGDNRTRMKAFLQLKKWGYKLPILIHPTANVEKNASLGEGAQVCMGSIIGTEASVGQGAILNTGSILDHESLLGPFSHVAPGCSIAGRVQIGQGTFVGIGSKINDQIKIGPWTTVGSGSVVIKNIMGGKVAYGVPAKEKS